MLVAVTGATGFLGRWVLRELRAAGHEVRALHRSADPPAFPGADEVAWERGVLPGELPATFPGPGVDLVLHLAALYAEGEAARVPTMAVNRDGTRSVLDACVRDSVPRVLHCSTMGTCAAGADRIATEADQPEPEALSPYARSKWEGERLALEEKRLEVVVANPAAPVGAWDVGPSVTGARVRDVALGRWPRLLSGAVNHLPARAAARGLLAAALRGRPGQRYLLGGENLGPDAFLERCARAAGVPVPRRDLVQRLLRRGRPSPGGLAIDDRRAREELGHEPGDLDEAFAEAAAWFRNGTDPT